MARNWKASGVVPCSEHRVLPVASEVLPMGNSTLTSIAGERTTAAYTVHACASSHRETKKKSLSDLMGFSECSWNYKYVSVCACVHAPVLTAS